jgi:manganese/zinc/iron transport system permease protein
MSLSPEVEIQWIAAVTAAACALPGVFLVLRRMALMSDAISHAILLGIVLAFFVTENLASPLLIAAAAATGVLTVTLVELLGRTGRVKEDAAIGLVFPALFSTGVIVHLDVDAVLLGELAFAPFNRWVAGGTDLGPRTLWVMGAILLLNAGFVAAFYKELKLTTFDAALAGALGFAPGLVHYAFMTLVSATAVGAFDAVGSVLVVALMIGPPAAAYLLTDRLPRMILLSMGIGVASALAGYWMSYFLDVSIAGSMATMTGVAFALVFLLAPERGMLALARRRARQRWEFAQTMLAIHLLNHEHSPDEGSENCESHLHAHLRWSPDFAAAVVRRAEGRGLVARQGGGDRLALTERGRSEAREVAGV